MRPRPPTPTPSAVGSGRGAGIGVNGRANKPGRLRRTIRRSAAREPTMSEGTQRPDTDADAWAKACAEDLSAERARRRRQAGTGYEPGSAADELRKLAETIVDKVAELRSPGASMTAQAM